MEHPNAAEIKFELHPWEFEYCSAELAGNVGVQLLF